MGLGRPFSGGPPGQCVSPALLATRKSRYLVRTPLTNRTVINIQKINVSICTHIEGARALPTTIC